MALEHCKNEKDYFSFFRKKILS